MELRGYPEVAKGIVSREVYVYSAGCKGAKLPSSLSQGVGMPNNPNGGLGY